MKTVWVVLANGFEEMEAIAPIDLLRRAGAEVTVVAIGQSSRLTGRNGIRLEVDRLWDDLPESDCDLIVVPGGPAFKELRVHPGLRARLQAQAASARPVAAICAAPSVLLDAGLLEGRRYTAHMSMAGEMPALADEAVVEDRGVVTSRGAGTATEFGLHLVEMLYGAEKRQEIAASIHYRP